MARALSVCATFIDRRAVSKIVDPSGKPRVFSIAAVQLAAVFSSPVSQNGWAGKNLCVTRHLVLHAVADRPLVHISRCTTYLHGEPLVSSESASAVRFWYPTRSSFAYTFKLIGLKHPYAKRGRKLSRRHDPAISAESESGCKGGEMPAAASKPYRECN